MTRLDELMAISRARSLTDSEADECKRLSNNERRARHRRDLYASDPVWRLTKLKAQHEYWRRSAESIGERRRQRYAADPQHRARRLATDGKASRCV